MFGNVRLWTKLGLVVAILCNLMALGANALLWQYPSGGSFHPMIEATLLMLGACGGLVFALPVSVGCVARSKGMPPVRRLAVVALCLALTPAVLGFGAWNYIIDAHRLTLSD